MTEKFRRDARAFSSHAQVLAQRMDLLSRFDTFLTLKRKLVVRAAKMNDKMNFAVMPNFFSKTDELTRIVRQKRVSPVPQRTLSPAYFRKIRPRPTAHAYATLR
jgi:hypothetical protein